VALFKVFAYFAFVKILRRDRFSFSLPKLEGPIYVLLGIFLDFSLNPRRLSVLENQVKGKHLNDW
jgi:hypothetical protein